MFSDHSNSSHAARGSHRHKYNRSGTSSSSRSSSDERRYAKDSGSSGGGRSGSAVPRSDLELYSGSRSSRRSYLRRRSYSGSESPEFRSERTQNGRYRNRMLREQPQASRCIGVFGLSTNTTQPKIRELFSKFGPIERIQMVIDAHTNRSRGFCFIYFENLSDASVAKDTCSGIEVDGRRIRVDYSITQRAHTPTPGVYLGRNSRRSRRSRDHYTSSSRTRRDSVSPYAYYRSRSSRYREYRRSPDRRYRYERSRSRSEVRRSKSGY